MPHPDGDIAMVAQQLADHTHFGIELPPGLSGQLILHDRSYPLHAGYQEFSISDSENGQHEPTQF